MGQVTQMLAELEAGDRQSADELLRIVYDELRTMAAAQLARESPGQTLQATALVHEAYLRLTGGKSIDEQPQSFAGRRHFFAAAAEAMRRILVENARRKKRVRHGGEVHRADVDLNLVGGPETDEDLLVLDQALAKFQTIDPEKAELIQLRYFVGMTIDEAADVLGISSATAKRHWRYARAWLHREMTGEDISQANS